MSDSIQDVLANVPEDNFVDTPQVEIWSDEENKGQFIAYIQTELEAVASDAGRTVKMARIETIRRQRVAKTAQETKDFPWANASNIAPPLAMEKTNTVTTKLVQNYTEKIPMFQYDSTPVFKKQADAITRHIQKENESPYGINLYNKLWDIIYDCVSLGTRFVKVPFTQQYMNFTRLGEDGGNEKVHKLIKSSPDIIPIPFEDFMTRPEWTDIQKAPWIGVRYYKHTHELKRLAQQGFYSNVDQIIAKSNVFDEHKENEMIVMGLEQSGAQAQENYIYEIYEVNCFWDADGDGFDEDIIVHIEKDSGTILRAEYNDLGIRDYVRIPYLDIPNNLYGVGVGDIMMTLQEEAESLHNMRNDGTQLAMLPFVVSSTQSDMGKSMNLFPGKWVKTPVPREDILIHKFPDIGASAMAAESLVMDYADKATGASESLGGRDVGGSNRIGATGTQFLASQSTGFLNSIALQMSNKFAEIGMLLLYRMVRHSDVLNLDSLDDADKQLVTQVYNLKVEDIPASFKFKTRLSTLQDSKATKQQESTQLMGLYGMYGDKMIELSAQMNNPQLAQAPMVMEAIQTYMVGFTNMMEKVLVNYDQDNVGDYTMFLDGMKLQLNLQDGQRKQEVDNAESQIAGGQGGPTSGEGLVGGGGGQPSVGQTTGTISGSGGSQTAEGSETIGGEPV
jgi:hypothetical protein